MKQITESMANTFDEMFPTRYDSTLPNYGEVELIHELKLCFHNKISDQLAIGSKGNMKIMLHRELNT